MYLLNIKNLRGAALEWKEGFCRHQSYQNIGTLSAPLVFTGYLLHETCSPIHNNQRETTGSTDWKLRFSLCSNSNSSRIALNEKLILSLPSLCVCIIYECAVMSAMLVALLAMMLLSIIFLPLHTSSFG